MKKYFLIAFCSLFFLLGSVFAEAIQIDFLLSGMRNPVTDEPLNGGKVYTYEGGTSTPINLYLDRDKTISSANPVILDAYGRAIVFGDGLYRFIVKNASDTIIWSSDGLEYEAVVSDSNTYMGLSGGKWDAEGAIIKNLTAGTTTGEAVEYNQWHSANTALQTNIDAVQTNVTNQTFTDLTDTPSGYAGSGDMAVVVNAGATALQFVDVNSLVANSAFLSLTDTPASYTSHAGEVPTVNAGETGLEFKPIGDVPIGTVMMYAGSTGGLPSNWRVCDGTLLDSATYPDLYTSLGNVWGVGGAGTFRIPDLRGMFAKGVGTNAHSGIVKGDGGAYVGGSLGVYTEDSFQGHDHHQEIDLISGGSSGFAGYNSGFLSINSTQGVVDDRAGSYGTARPSDVTEPAHASLYYIIRVL